MRLPCVQGEVYNMIAQRTLREAPMNYLMMVTIANGSLVSYMPTDDAYGRHTFQVLGSRFKPGCIEESIVNGVLDLIEESGH